MKLEILKSDEGVQIHLENEDGSKTVWLCDTEQAAIFKLASILFSAPEDPKHAGRCIMVGEFTKEPEEKRSLSERAAEVAKTVEKSGLQKKGDASKPDVDMEKFAELIKLFQKEQPATFDTPILAPFMVPNVKIYPASFPQPVPMMPYIGDFPMESYPFIDVNVGGGQGLNVNHTIDLSKQDMFYGVGGPTACALLEDVPVSSHMNASGKLTNFFRTTIHKTTG